MPPPTIGRIVVLRLRGRDIAAIVTQTLDQQTPDDPYPLDDTLHVHVEPFMPPGLSEPSHAETCNVGFSEDAGVPGAQHKDGTWRWPERV